MRELRPFHRRRLPHLEPGTRTAFVTFCTADRWELPEPVRRLVIDTCLVGHGARFWLHAVVVMPDHVHLLLSPYAAEDGESVELGAILRSIKGASARAINLHLGRQGAVWQRESFDHVLRSDEALGTKAEYVCQNPVRRGLVEHEDDYPWLWREWVEGKR